MAKAQVQSESGSRKRDPKAMLVVAALLVVEAGVIVGAMALVGREPQVSVASDGFMDEAVAEDEKIVEVLVLDAKLPNAKTGIAYLYGTEIYVQVKQKHADQVAARVQQFYNEIKADITAVWRTSEPQQFQEPKLESLTRKVKAMLDERFGVDPETDEPIVKKCVVVMGTGFRVDR